jgi:hypothetical protein
MSFLRSFPPLLQWVLRMLGKLFPLCELSVEFSLCSVPFRSASVRPVMSFAASQDAEMPTQFHQMTVMEKSL